MARLFRKVNSVTAAPSGILPNSRCSRRVNGWAGTPSGAAITARITQVGYHRCGRISDEQQFITATPARLPHVHAAIAGALEPITKWRMGALPEIWGGCKARGGKISFRDIRLTSNAAAAPKIGNPEGCFLAGGWPRCSSVREPCGYLPSSRLASHPPENSAPVPHFVIGS